MPLQKTLRIREVKARQTKAGDIYDIAGDDNVEYQTFDKDIALSAQSYAGPSGPLVTLTYSEKQKGQYTNRYADRIEPAAAQAQLPIGNVVYAPTYQPPNLGPGGLTSGVSMSPPSPLPVAPPAFDKETRIMRQTGAKVAVNLLPYLPEHERTPQGLLLMADYLVDYFVNGVPALASSIQGDPGPMQSPAYSDNDIPF